MACPSRQAFPSPKADLHLFVSPLFMLPTAMGDAAQNNLQIDESFRTKAALQQLTRQHSPAKPRFSARVVEW